MKKYFYEKNRFLLEHEVNKCFEEVLWMDEKAFQQWVIDLRKAVVYSWDVLGLPPRVGYDEGEMIDQFSQMNGFITDRLFKVDELTGERDVIHNTFNIGNGVNQFFPTMMKTKINYTKKGDGKSIYDFFARDDLLERFTKYSRRHFKRDSFYHYSQPVRQERDNPITAVQWIKNFEENVRQHSNQDYWLAPVDEDKEYSGYATTDLRDQKYLIITKDEIEQSCMFGDKGDHTNFTYIPFACRTNVDYDKSETYQIRLFERGQKLFPVGFKAFRVSYCQYAVNFPPLVAKAIYEKYTEHFKDQPEILIYDPSMGWAGRELGALTVKDDRTILYIGTDPNTDHNTDDGRTKYHQIEEFVNTKTSRNSPFTHTNKCDIFQKGSEVIKDDPKFLKYKGKLDLVFTSPPYFAKEAYSDDPEQSCHKFPQYEGWIEGFLRPTLETAVEWLKSDRYLLWNIADAVFDGERLPLEQASIDILTSLGMEYKGKLKMALAAMPGANRLTESGDFEEFEVNTLEGTVTEKKAIYAASTKNVCKINARMVKYEPIFVFRKP